MSLAQANTDRNPSALSKKNLPRLALVIGNSQYQSSPLKNPYNDANDMAAALGDLGFEVILETDLSRQKMFLAIREFGKRLKAQKGIGLFYYAGHGVQVDNTNYLIPVDSPVEAEDEIESESIKVSAVLKKMQSAANPLNIIVLDACRNNPFPGQFRSTSRGLARMDPPIGSLVVYATAPGRVAADGDGRNGVFTSHLLKQLKQPGLSLTETVRRTRAAVVAETRGTQVPWENSSLLEDVYLSDPPENSSNAPQSSAEILFWSSVDSGKTAGEYQAYLKNYPKGLFADLAQARLSALADSSADGGSSTPKVNNDQLLAELVLDGATQTKSESTAGTRSFSVRATPADARIRIMNIRERYRAGINLHDGRVYDILVQAPGHENWRQSITLSPQTAELVVELQPMPQDTKQVVASSGLKSGWMPKMRSVKAGRFDMGCSPKDGLCTKSEQPVRTVELNSFRISSTEVTVEQFSAFVSATAYVTDAERNSGGLDGCFVWTDRAGINRSNAGWEWQGDKNWKNPGYEQTSRHPVTCISWNDAQAYVKWLSAKTARTFSLPTEAQWEFAARAGTTSRYSHGDSVRRICDFGNGADRTESRNGSSWSGALKCNDRYWFSAPVGSYKANALGLYDMMGNTWEWVTDNWSDALPAETKNGSAFLKGDGSYRVMRGGAWDGNQTALRASHRMKGLREGRAAMTGFRVAE